jgi:hypothetical protein
LAAFISRKSVSDPNGWLGIDPYTYAFSTFFGGMFTRYFCLRNDIYPLRSQETTHLGLPQTSPIHISAISSYTQAPRHPTSKAHESKAPRRDACKCSYQEEGYFSLLDCLRRELGKHAPRKNGFEAYLAFYIHKVFENSARLNDVFSFRSDFARRKGSDLPWQTNEFELVTVSFLAGTGEQSTSVVAPLCGPSSNVGFLAKTDDEVLNWASENQNRYAFCFPTETAGPDIFFYIRNKSTGELLLVAMQAKFYQDVDSATLVDGVCTVTPSLFWKRKGGKVRVTVSLEIFTLLDII